MSEVRAERQRLQFKQRLQCRHDATTVRARRQVTRSQNIPFLIMDQDLDQTDSQHDHGDIGDHVSFEKYKMHNNLGSTSRHVDNNNPHSHIMFEQISSSLNPTHGDDCCSQRYPPRRIAQPLELDEARRSALERPDAYRIHKRERIRDGYRRPSRPRTTSGPRVRHPSNESLLHPGPSVLYTKYPVQNTFQQTHQEGQPRKSVNVLSVAYAARRWPTNARNHPHGPCEPVVREINTTRIHKHIETRVLDENASENSSLSGQTRVEGYSAITRQRASSAQHVRDEPARIVVKGGTTRPQSDYVILCDQQANEKSCSDDDVYAKKELNERHQSHVGQTKTVVDINRRMAQSSACLDQHSTCTHGCLNCDKPDRVTPNHEFAASSECTWFGSHFATLPSYMLVEENYAGSAVQMYHQVWLAMHMHIIGFGCCYTHIILTANSISSRDLKLLISVLAISGRTFRFPLLLHVTERTKHVSRRWLAQFSPHTV